MNLMDFLRCTSTLHIYYIYGNIHYSLKCIKAEAYKKNIGIELKELESNFTYIVYEYKKGKIQNRSQK